MEEVKNQTNGTLLWGPLPQRAELAVPLTPPAGHAPAVTPAESARWECYLTDAAVVSPGFGHLDA